VLFVSWAACWLDSGICALRLRGVRSRSERCQTAPRCGAGRVSAALRYAARSFSGGEEAPGCLTRRGAQRVLSVYRGHTTLTPFRSSPTDPPSGVPQTNDSFCRSHSKLLLSVGAGNAFLLWQARRWLFVAAVQAMLFCCVSPILALVASER
jgi:hypothetical protein